MRASGNAVAPRRWPTTKTIQPVPGIPTLVMLAHPQCACTKASLGELALIMARLQGRLKAYVVFYQPAGFPATWVETDTWRAAQQIPGVTVIRDLDGQEARRFSAQASGQTLLYDASGALRFSGGITWARGHGGDNAGRAAIVGLVESGRPGQERSPVFGCAIFNRAETKGVR